MSRLNLRILNRDAIKYIAVFAMLLNHISYIFMEDGHFLSELFENTGYMTALTMCYFLTEGYYLTRSRRKYAARLFIFAVISEIPYCIALTGDALISFTGFNMLFTLLICFAILYVNEYVMHPTQRNLYIILLIFLSDFCDWPLIAPVFTLLFISAREGRCSLKQAFLYSTLLYGGFVFLSEFSDIGPSDAFLKGLTAMTGPLLSGILILYFYTGKPAGHGKAFSKWFFYLFYPLHLLVLGMIRISLM